jgi:preprotein translocase subunit SecG
MGVFLMLYEILVALFTIMCFVLILLVLIQKGKSSMGLGGLGGGSQMLFGGSGGQDFFQKLTWALCFIFMIGSLILAVMKKPGKAKYLAALEQQAAARQIAENATPVSQPINPEAQPIEQKQ